MTFWGEITGPIFPRKQQEEAKKNEKKVSSLKYINGTQWFIYGL